MRYWNFLRNPSFKVLLIQLLFSFISFFIGPLLAFIIAFISKTNLSDQIYLYLYGIPTFISGLLVLVGIANLFFYIKYKLTGNKNVKLIPSGQFIIVILILIGIIYLITPKISSSGGLCEGCEIKRCDCLGYESFDYRIPGNTRCVGIIYNCSTTIFHL